MVRFSRSTEKRTEEVIALPPCFGGGSYVAEYASSTDGCAQNKRICNWSESKPSYPMRFPYRELMPRLQTINVRCHWPTSKPHATRCRSLFCPTTSNISLHDSLRPHPAGFIGLSQNLQCLILTISCSLGLSETVMK